MPIRKLIFAAALVATTAPAFADITRGCASQLYYQDTNTTFVLANIEGRGRCKNKFKANDCGLYARRAIVACASALWRDRWDQRVPQECRFYSGSGRAQANLTWTGGIQIHLPGDSVKARMEYAACCPTGRRDRSVIGALKLKVTGDKYCSFNATISGYDTDCKAVREKGYCG